MSTRVQDESGCLFIFTILAAILLVIIYYSAANDVSINEVESKEIIKPDYRLEANGKKVDTIYIYKFK